MHQTPSACIGLLPHLGILTVGGPDQLAFLQGQATCDFRNRSETQAWPGAFCNAKGRGIANFIALGWGETCRLVLSHELVDDLRVHLQRYVLRAKVTLEAAQDDCALLGIVPPVSLPGNLALPSSELEVQRENGRIFVRMRGNAPRGLILTTPADAAELIETYVAAGCAHQEQPDFWCREDILAGWPWVCAATRERFTPQMLGLDQLGAISFEKGCYTGQEIVARTHYLGTAKRGIRSVQGTGLPPAPGEHWTGGIIVNTAPDNGGWVGLAVASDAE
ncbi:MAG TPA: folate-binding protein [Methylococcaceae bacterium]|nr:folate-binding protein [Methylococcaceae bacterium]